MGCPLSTSPWSRISLWHETAGDDWTPRPALPGDTDVDVAIVGAGFTGLWTAYYLAEADPSLRIAVLEAEIAGFGASGRNGGWCSALFPASLDQLARLGRPRGGPGPAPGDARHRRRGRAGRRRRGHRRPRRQGRHDRAGPQPGPAGAGPGPRSADARAWGRGEDDVRLLDAAEARRDPRRQPARSARRTPPTARRSTPRRLVRGLADGGRAARRADPRAAPGSPRSSPAGSRTAHGTVRAETVVRATEGYTAALRRAPPRAGAGLLADHRDRAAADAELWDRIGLARRETFTDHRHLIIYGQRTADDRLVFGGRGAPYHFGSRIRPAFDRDEPRLRAPARRRWSTCFPVLAGDPGHARLGRRARHPARLVRLGRPGPRDRAGLGRRVRRRRRRARPTSPAARCATWSSAATPS